MNLRSMLSVIRVLGKYRLMANGNTATLDQLQIVSAATEVLRQWPMNFIQLMSDLGEALPASPSGGVGRQFEGIYRALFKNKAVEPHQQADFLKSAFVEFATNHWGRGFVDHKLIKQVSGPTRRRYVTQSEFAAKLGVQQRTAARFLKAKQIAADRVRCGRVERVIVDVSHDIGPGTRPGRILRSRVAARQLGVPVSVLNALRRTGELEVRHLSRFRTGWHEKDVEAFRGKLLSLVRSTVELEFGSVKIITVGAIMRNRHYSSGVKADFVRALLSKQIPAFGNENATIGEIRIDLYLYKKWVETAGSQAAGNTRTPTEVAKSLRCDRGTIPGLMQLGLLQGTRTPHGLRIDEDSATRFGREYVTLASYAKRLGTSTRALMRSCKQNGVYMLLVPVVRQAGPQPFIRVADLASLRRSVQSQIQGPDSEKTPRQLAGSG
jgi:hypothetical protein